jgi:hypothetical protein
MDLKNFYLARIGEITRRPTYHGADSNLVADIYERRLHKITQTTKQTPKEN